MPVVLSDINKIEEANRIRDQICQMSWEEIKNSQEILAKTFSEEYETNPAQLLMIDRNFFLEKIFINPEIIPESLKTAAIMLYSYYDFSQDINKIQQDYWDIAKGLNFRENIDLGETQAEAKNIANGLVNLVKLTYTKEANDLMTQLLAIRSLSESQISEMYTRLANANKYLDEAVKNNRALNINEINDLIDIEKHFGRIGMLLEDLRKETDPPVFLNLIMENRQALTVLEVAIKNNLLSEINNPSVVADILEGLDRS